jgi:hypothetical protein
MSIKAIHIFLISCATLLSFGFGVWLLGYAKSSSEAAYRMAGFVSFAAGFGLTFYGIHFIKKAKSL